MITAKEIERKTMSKEKRESAKNDYFAFYIGRPMSYILTIPFLYINISPNMISVLSVVPLIFGFILMCVGHTKNIFLCGWLLFFLWNLLDGVDGNVARYKRQFSSLGSVYDAMSGYMAMVLSFFAWGVAAAHHPGIFQNVFQFSADLYIILGALSGIFVIFPRLIMHKTITALGNEDAVRAVKNKAEFGFVKILALNLTSVSGFVQVFMLIAVLCNMMDLFTIVYFVLNLMVMLLSLKNILQGERKVGGKKE